MTNNDAMRIMIDAGHGVDTPGKRSPDGKFREYLWNRQVADKVAALLSAKGVDTAPVVTELNDIPLKTRAARVNAVCDTLGASNVLLVSIHSNAAGNGTTWANAKGWSCYTTVGRTESDSVAECLYDAFEKAFPERRIRKDMSDGDRDWEANFYILKNTRCPAVLLENFFYDNEEECRWLLREDTKDRIAAAVVDGLVQYLAKR